MLSIGASLCSTLETSTEWGSRGDLWVAGPHTQAIFRIETGIARTLALRLKPGWSVPARGVTTNEPTDRIVPLEDIWGRAAQELLDDGEVRIESVAHRLGVSDRHLRRAFSENVGVGPKEFARTVRLQRAVRMTATSSDWARIAADAGYYDQAHLIGDFRQLVGLTPGTFLARRQRLGPERFVTWTR